MVALQHMNSSACRIRRTAAGLGVSLDLSCALAPSTTTKAPHGPLPETVPGLDLSAVELLELF
jgi:hypothetical protein